MSTFPGTYVPTGIASTPKFNHLIDDLMTPRLMSFRQICIHDEKGSLDPNDQMTWGVTWGNWLTAAPIRVRKNEVLVADALVTNVNYGAGTFEVGAVTVDASGRPRTTVEVDYWIDYFWPEILEGFYTVAVSIVNTSGYGPPTTYTIETMPTNWEGVVTDLAFAMCMEKLLLDYDLWRYRLLFAIGPSEMESGGGDIVGQLETLKSNAEERANKTLDNEKFKVGNYLSPPTTFYFQGISGIGGSGGAGCAGGRLRGWKPNRYT